MLLSTWKSGLFCFMQMFYFYWKTTLANGMIQNKIINCTSQVIHCHLAMTRGQKICISCVLCHQLVFQTGRVTMIAQFAMTKDTDHFGLVNGTIWQLFKSKLSIQNLIGIYFGISRSPYSCNVTCLLLFGWLASPNGVPVILLLV